MRFPVIASYYRITKPGIIRGNIITLIAAYVFASQGDYDLVTFLALGSGSALVIAAGCVLNNIFDADIDSIMPRTKARELVVQAISTRAAYVYATVLTIMGITLLAVWTNILTVLCGLVGLVFYAFVYTYAKRKTYWSTLIGTIPGATPPVAGYVAVTNRFDTTALLLFLVLVCWQMPHFLAIAIRRIDDYRQAKIPLLPIAKGIRRTKLEMYVYIVGFVLVTLLLGWHESLGRVYIVFMLLTGSTWLYIALHKNSNASGVWAKKVFLFSLVSLLLFDVFIALDYYIN